MKCFSVAVVLILASFSAHAEEALPRQLEDVGIDEHLGAILPLDLKFRNEAGENVALHSFFDGQRPVVMALAYYECPMLCGLLLNGVTKAFSDMSWAVGDQFRFVVVSIDPKETPELAFEKRKNFLEKYGRKGAGGGWNFLVGNEGEIKALAQTIGFKYRYDEEQKQYAHAAAVYVLTPNGVISRYLYGIDFKPRDLRLALLEATKGKIGTVVDRLLMFCYHYDPQTRHYSLVAIRMMQIGGVVTVFAIAILVVTGFRRRKGAGIAQS